VKGRVLVIDDEAEIRRNLTFGLTQEEYSVVACPDGISAIHELEQSKQKGIGYDYLVTDIFMPDIDGLKILKVIKYKYPELPVLVITGFGDQRLKDRALSQANTGYLDKPFQIPELVNALKNLSPGKSTIESTDMGNSENDVNRESVSAYLTVKITDPARSMDIYTNLHDLDGIVSCEAVRGDVDIILLGRAESQTAIKDIFDNVRALEGLEVASVSEVERPKLDKDIDNFIKIYEKALQSEPASTNEDSGTRSYIIVDIDKDAIQQIFTTVFFIDEVLFCDIIDHGSKLVGMISGSGSTARMPRIIEKLSEIDGVLRVREARIINLIDD
jgi:two-component system, cell cycle response regulator CpdR